MQNKTFLYSILIVIAILFFSLFYIKMSKPRVTDVVPTQATPSASFQNNIEEASTSPSSTTYN